MVGTSTGIEPFYSWTYFRKSRLGWHEERVGVVEAWYRAHPGATELPEHFVTAMELTPFEHVGAQAAIQRWVDSAISKTCNVPNDYTIDQTRELYEHMYRLGCKGGTVYRDGSRDEQVLHLADHADVPAEDAEASDAAVAAVAALAVPADRRTRPRRTTGATYRVNTPFGKAYVTVNHDADGEPFEVFVNIGKAGSDLSADAEAIGRLISCMLRMPSPLPPVERLELVIQELTGIGGSRHVGFGAERVRSIPDGVAHALRESLADAVEEPLDPDQPSLFEATPVARVALGAAEASSALVPAMPGADLCPVCGHATFVRVEGCQKCGTCGHSEC